MNPFDLPGPEFLAFYGVLAVVMLMALYLRRGMSEPAEPPHVRFEDPYLIAFLRGGKNEALRVATVSLIDRGVLKWEGTVLSATQNLPKRPIEQALVRKFTPFADATSIFADAPLEAACDDYRAMLTRLGLIPDDAQVAARRRRLWLALAVLVGVSAAKIWVAVGRGRTNIGGLVVLTLFAVVIAVKLHNPLRTPAGNQLLADLRALFSRLKERAHTLRPGGESSEVALLAAVFGVGALSHILFPYARQLFPRASSSAGSSCGSSCGGGGDGGGGGGCGGCGGGGGD